MTPQELRRIKRTFDTLEGGFLRRCLQHFKRVLLETEPHIEDAFRTGAFDNFEMPGRKRYLVLFKRYVQECFLRGMNLADQELIARLARFDDQKQPPLAVIPEEAMAWMDRWTERFGPEYYGDLTNRVVGTLKQGLAEGLSVPATMYRLEEVLTGPEFNRNRLEIIARTNATTAFNQGRLEMFNQDPDFVPYVEFLAILDSRTTDICEARNGKIFRTGSADVAANTPPLHYRCRSFLSPVTTYDLEDMQKGGWKDPEGNTLQQKMDLSGMPQPQKGFGSVGRVLEGKLGKQIENNPFMRAITDEEIDAAERKFLELEKRFKSSSGPEANLSFPVAITKERLRDVADYLNDPDPRGNEIGAWDQLLTGNYYGYSIYAHELTEIDSLRRLIAGSNDRRKQNLSLYEANRDKEMRKEAHGDGCFLQYKMLQEYISIKFKRPEERLTQLAFCDSWEMLRFDRKFAERFSAYLYKYQRKWYNEHNEKYPWDFDYYLRNLFGKLRDENGDSL